MGRVYNALVKAEKWQDGDRSIGRPDRQDSVRQDADAPSTSSFKVSPPLPSPPVFEDIVPVNGDPVATAPGGSINAVESTRAGFVPRPAVSPRRRAVPEPPIASPRVLTFEEPSEVLNIRDLATDPRMVTLTGDDPLAMERYRGLAVKLLNQAERRKLKTLLITSAEAGEGKTTVAAVAAWLMAKHTERRVLLIDANPASPSVGHTLGLDPKRGWMNLIDRSCELKHALVRVDPNGLYVMTPGTPGALQSTDEMSSRLEDVIAELAPRFDMVVVDSPAILDSPEAQRLATVMDGVVLVARASHTHHSKVTAARKLVPKERRLGVVLNESEAGVGFAQRRGRKTSLMERLFGRKRISA